MNPFFDIFGWSLRLFRAGGIEWRLSFMLLVWMLFELIQAIQAHGGDPLRLALAPLVPLVVMLWHAGSHVLGAHLVGGRTSTVLASALVDQNVETVPQTAWAVSISAGAGPLGSGLLALAGWAQGGDLGQRVAFMSGLVAVANLLACHPFDGRRLWRGLLWPLVGLRKAGQATVMLGFASAVLLLVLALWRTDFLLLFMAVWCLIGTLHDYGHQEPGYDPALDTDPRIHSRRSGPGLWGRLQAHQAAKAEARAEVQAAKDGEILDRLLAKVSAHGLPSLTEAERKQLQDISKRQRDS